jgi:hypothetical protein
MAQGLLPADGTFIRHAFQLRGILVQVIKQKHFFLPDEQQKGISHADPAQPFRPYPGRYQRRAHLVILPPLLPDRTHLFIGGGHCVFHPLAGRPVFPLKRLEKTFYSRAAGQLPSGIAPHAVRQDQYQGVIPGQDGKGILLIAAGAQNLVPMQSGNHKRFLGKRLLRHGGEPS